jgi:hypothetical protein
MGTYSGGKPTEDPPPGEEVFSYEEVLAKMEELHAQGVLDLDAPARNLVDVAEAKLRERALLVSDEPQEAADAYWLVGSKGWFSHATEEVEA